MRSVQGKLRLTWGMARIENVPEGAADLKVWHPEQLGDQPAQKLQIPAATLETAAQLNISPKARRVRVSDSGPAASNPS